MDNNTHQVIAKPVCLLILFIITLLVLCSLIMSGTNKASMEHLPALFVFWLSFILLILSHKQHILLLFLVVPSVVIGYPSLYICFINTSAQHFCSCAFKISHTNYYTLTESGRFKSSSRCPIDSQWQAPLRCKGEVVGHTSYMWTIYQ